MTRLRRLTPTICAFHLGFSLVQDDSADDNLRLTAAREIAELGDIGLAKKAFVSLVEAEGIDEDYRMEAAEEIIALGDAEAAYRAFKNYLGDDDFLEHARQWFLDRGRADLIVSPNPPMDTD